MRVAAVRIAFAVVLLIALVGETARAQTIKVDPIAAQNFRQLASGVQPGRIADTIKTLSSFGSRIPGYPGHDKARDYVIGRLSAILGSADVHVENFKASVPIDDGSSRISALGKSYRIWPLWPNVARTCTLPSGGVSGPLIYGGQGSLPAFNGKTVMGSVVMLDFNCGSHWLNAARLGAKAIIFVEPDLAMRGEAEAKILMVPANIPRFWIRRRDAAMLEAAALTTPTVDATVTCFNPFRTVTATNVIGVLPGVDPTMSRQNVIIESYYDSMSVVPSLAPGAESTCGTAALLELARLFKANPPKRSVIFVLTDAHGLGLLGMRTYVDAHVDDWLPISGWDRFVHAVFRVPLPHRTQIWLSTSLDLSSQSATVGGFYKGYFYDFREDVQDQFADIGRALNDNAAKIGQTLGFDPSLRYADGINPLGGKTWRNYLPAQVGLDGEVAVLAGGKAITFATCNDARQLVDTPADTFLNVNVSNVVQQVTLLAGEYWDILNDTNRPSSLPFASIQSVMPVVKYPSWCRQGLLLGFASVNGRALQFDPRKSFVPSTPIPGSEVVVYTVEKTYCGVRGNMLQGVDSRARFKFVGMPMIIAIAGSQLTTPAKVTSIAAYHTDDSVGPHRGDIDYAPDNGVNGAANYPTAFRIAGTEQSAQVVLFPCVSTSIFDLVNQSTLQSFDTTSILDGATNSEPQRYGFDASQVDPFSSYVEDVDTIYSTQGTRIKVVMSNVGSPPGFLLLNAKDAKSEKAAEGVGYDLANPNDPINPPGFIVDGSIAHAPLYVTRDMWNLDEFRIRQLAKYHITDDEMNHLHAMAGAAMEQARQALDRKDYTQFDSLIRESWGYEARVYPRAQQTADDVVVGVLFYLFLLIPFAFFMERLVFSFPDLKRQLIGVFAIFITVFLVFSQIHPAFDITANPSIVLIAFIMLALSLLVVGLIWGKFEEQMNSFSISLSGVHKVDIAKASVAMAAFALGISNMRRRTARTVLTCITLVLLTFIVLSFTSIVSTIRYNQNSAPGSPLYNGILLRSPIWSALQDPALRFLNDQFGGRYIVSPRAWYFGAPQGQQTFLTVSRASSSVDVKGVCGLSPQESMVTQPQKLLTAGRWFQPGDAYVTILPDTVAGNLGITPSDVGRVGVTYSGQDFLVIGIINGAKLNLLRDLDNEQIVPVDFLTQQGQVGGGVAKGFNRYNHVDSETVLFVPYDTLINMGGDLRSVAINFGSGATTKSVLQALMPRLDLNIYAGIDGRNYRFSAIGATAGTGLGWVIIPIILAALIVLSTMLQSVFERTREIAIFSSVGLSPGNIAMLFMAEALVYAVIGAVAGYVLGQGVSKVITNVGLLHGLSLNFSSTSAVLSTVTVIGVVLLSTIYPARKASQVATPAADRVWKLPQPQGDVWRLPLPFAITGNQARGVNQYLAEWFRSYEEQSVGEFLTQGIATFAVAFPNGEGQRVTGRAWLAPFDLGVSQDIVLDTEPSELEDVYDVVLTITRVSGDLSNWKRVNRRFLNAVRQQFLIWRTLSEEQRARYMSIQEVAAEASEHASGAFANVSEEPG